MTRKPYWHPWHYGGPIWWMTDEEYAARNIIIDTVKPKDERPVRHLRFQPVRGTLPAAYDKALVAHMPTIVALHAAECGCCWTPEQPNIFKGGRSLGRNPKK